MVGLAGMSSFLSTSEPMSGFSMSMYACMSEMADSDAPVKRHGPCWHVYCRAD